MVGDCNCITEAYSGVKVGGNTVPRPAISATWHSQASNSNFFCRNAHFQTGNVVLSIATDIFSMN